MNIPSKTVAVIFGGRSTEHDVSVVTALASVIKPLELSGSYAVEPIYIARSGAWYSDQKLKDIKLFSSGKIDDFLRATKPISLSFDGGLSLVRPSGLKGFSGHKSTKIDIVFPAMHGTFGEDGALMGLLDMAGIPYVGCSMAASVLAMDKVLAKLIAEAHGIATAKFQYFSRQKVLAEPGYVVAKCVEKLRFPMFAKPAHLGSSIGITRVVTAQELTNAIEIAAHYDDKIVIEEAVNNLIEVTLPIMGNDEPRPALLERPLTLSGQSEDFFDFDTKYMHGGKKGAAKNGQDGLGGKGSSGAQGYSELPAQLPPKLYAEAERIGLAVYKALGCSGTARVDLLIDSKTKQVYFNEVNPLPGSLYAHNWRAAGVSGVDLVKQLISFAEARQAERQKTTVVFSTNYLKQF